MTIDWKESPEWANWLAQDACGEWFWFESKPELQSEGWDDDKTYKENRHEIAGVNGWKCSLQKRPIRPQAERDREEVITNALRVVPMNVGDEVHPRQYLMDSLHDLYDAGMLRKGDEL